MELQELDIVTYEEIMRFRGIVPDLGGIPRDKDMEDIKDNE